MFIDKRTPRGNQPPPSKEVQERRKAANMASSAAALVVPALKRHTSTVSIPMGRTAGLRPALTLLPRLL